MRRVQSIDLSKTQSKQFESLVNVEAFFNVRECIERKREITSITGKQVFEVLKESTCGEGVCGIYLNPPSQTISP
jgi:hypothetical protein